MDEAQLLTCAKIQQVGQETGTVRTTGVLEMMTDFGQKEILVVGGIAPVELTV